MKYFSYTISQKKQKKIKISCTNRDPYLNHPTLIRSDYNNASGIKCIEYMKDIHITNITNEFVKYFNAFITKTGTQDLSNFFDIEIKNISTNLEKLLNNANNDVIDYSVFGEKNVNHDCGMKINEMYSSNYKFIVSTEQSHLETFLSSIEQIEKLENKNSTEFMKIHEKSKITLNSFILSDTKIDKSEKIPFTINVNKNSKISTLTNLLPTQEYTNVIHSDDEIFKYVKLLQSQSPFNINDNVIYKNIINHQNDNIIEKTIFSFQINDNLIANDFLLLDDNKLISVHENHQFKINDNPKNNILEKCIDEKVEPYNNPILEMNIVKINNFNFLNIKKSHGNGNTNNSRDEIVIFNNLLPKPDIHNTLFSSINDDKSISNYNNYDNGSNNTITNVFTNVSTNNNLNIDNILKLGKKDIDKNIKSNEKINSNTFHNPNNLIITKHCFEKEMFSNILNDHSLKTNTIIKNKENKENKENYKHEIPFVNMNMVNMPNLLSKINIFDDKNLFKEEKYDYTENEVIHTNFKINNKLSIIPINDEKVKVYTKETISDTIFSSINTIQKFNINKFIPENFQEFENKNNQNNVELNININKNITQFNNFFKNNINNKTLEDVKKKYTLNNLYSYCKCIINVYQLVYNENKIATGLGDFIRGSYFIIEFCKKHNFKYFIDLSNHPIKFFLKKYCNISLNEKTKNIYKKINKFEDNNFNPVIDKHNFIHNLPNEEINSKFVEYLLNEPAYNSNLYVYNTTFPKEGFSNNDKIIMRQIFEPTTRMELIINVKLKMLNLKPYSYEIIHIRCGDEYISNETINYNSVNFEIILNDLEKLNPNKKYLLISDNNFIKTFVKERFNFINILYHDIIHTGENHELIVKKLENTILDFYLISVSKNVMSYSVYTHGTGFSKWCAFTYDIPYYCKYFGKS
jgi:hypothetical protein